MKRREGGGRKKKDRKELGRTKRMCAKIYTQKSMGGIDENN